MEHAFPPPFRWESNEGFELLVAAGLILVATAIAVGVMFRGKPHPGYFLFWILFTGLCVYLSFQCPEALSENWRYRAVATPMISTCGLLSAAIAFVAGYCEFIRLWKAKRVLETLVTVLIPGTLIVLLLPSYVCNFHGPSARAECKNNLKQIGLALHNYHETHSMFTASRLSDPPISWRVHLLPYLDNERLWQEYDQEQAWDSEANSPIAETDLWTYRCPTRWRRNDKDEQGRYFTDYAMLTGTGAFSLPNRPSRLQTIIDGASNTLAVVEAAGQNIVWTEPRDANAETQPIGINLAGDENSESRGIASSRHALGVNVLFADGTVRTVDENIDPQVLKALTTIAGGEPVGDF